MSGYNMDDVRANRIAVLLLSQDKEGPTTEVWHGLRNMAQRYLEAFRGDAPLNMGGAYTGGDNYGLPLPNRTPPQDDAS